MSSSSFRVSTAPRARSHRLITAVPSGLHAVKLAPDSRIDRKSHAGRGLHPLRASTALPQTHVHGRTRIELILGVPSLLIVPMSAKR